jgi:gluconolactonase
MADVSAMKILASGLLFPEGPAVAADGSVLLVEVRSGLVKRVGLDGEVKTYADCAGGPCGLAFGPDGGLYVCNNGGNVYRPDHFVGAGPSPDYQGGSIQRVDPKTRAVTTLYTHCGEHRLSAPNDIVFDRHGGFYFSEMGKKHARHRDHGGIYYATCDGLRITEVAYHVAAANGIGLSPDGRTLYVAETETCRLWAFDIVEPGKVAKQSFPSPHGGRFVAGLPGFQRFDSLAMTAAGNICVATLVSGRITVISPGGEILRQVQLPDCYVTNICFGGPQLRTAFITMAETGRLATLPWPEPGLALHFSFDGR